MSDCQIDRLIEEVIEREGGYVDHPADRGGPTRWGITEAVARRQGYMDDMRTCRKAMLRPSTNDYTG